MFMDKDLYITELWEDLKQVNINLLYLDEFRANKAKIEPVYRGCVGVVALITAVVSFFDTPFISETMAILTAAGVIVPMIFPFLPTLDRFSEIDELRISLKNRLLELEELWRKEKDDATYKRYQEGRKQYTILETKLSALFGIINEKWNKRLIKRHEEYLDKFTFS